MQRHQSFKLSNLLPLFLLGITCLLGAMACKGQDSGREQEKKNMEIEEEEMLRIAKKVVAEAIKQLAEEARHAEEVKHAEETKEQESITRKIAEAIKKISSEENTQEATKGNGTEERAIEECTFTSTLKELSIKTSHFSPNAKLSCVFSLRGKTNPTCTKGWTLVAAIKDYENRPFTLQQRIMLFPLTLHFSGNKKKPQNRQGHKKLRDLKLTKYRDGSVTLFIRLHIPAWRFRWNVREGFKIQWSVVPPHTKWSKLSLEERKQFYQGEEKVIFIDKKRASFIIDHK